MLGAHDEELDLRLVVSRRTRTRSFEGPGGDPVLESAAAFGIVTGNAAAAKDDDASAGA